MSHNNNILQYNTQTIHNTKQYTTNVQQINKQRVSGYEHTPLHCKNKQIDKAQ